MKRQFFIIALGLGLNLPFQVAAASGCTVEKYTHNGSLVDAKSCTGKLTMTYTQPGPELVKRGARKGSMMFTGTEQAGGAISGHALTLDARCGGIAFAVAGSKQGGAIVLQGNVPVRDSSCQISRHEAYRMVFSPQASNPVVNTGTGNAPAVVTPSCPAGYVFSQGQCLPNVTPQSDGQSVKAPTAVSSSSPADASSVKQQLSRTEITIAFQQELERLGCNPGPADGDWGKKGRAALTKFNVYAKLKLPTDAPTMDALEAVKGNKERVCPLVCGPQFNIEGDQCVKKTCSSGQTLSSKGQCVKVAVNKLENQSQVPKKSGKIHCESNEFCCGRFKRGTVCTECCPI